MTMFRALRLSTGLLCTRQLCLKPRKSPYSKEYFMKKWTEKPKQNHWYGSLKDTKALEMPILQFITDAEATQFLENLEEDYKKKLKFFKHEYSILLEIGARVPTTITDKQWIKLLQADSKKGLKRRLEILYKKEAAKEGKKAAIELNKKLVEPQEKEEGDPPFHNVIIRRIPFNMMNYLPRLVTSMQFGQPLIIDCDYVDYMRNQQISRTAEQLCDAYALNRSCSHPYNLIFCNSGKGKKIMHEIFHILKVDEDNLPAIITEKHYLDLFPRAKLVYLSPDSNNILRKFDPTDIYIIGGFVDTFDTSCKVSIKKARADNIRHAKIAVNKYFKVQQDIYFTLDQMMKFMINFRANKSVKEAITLSYPKRKLVKPAAPDLSRKAKM